MSRVRVALSMSLAGAAGGILSWGLLAVLTSVVQVDAVAGDLAAKALFGVFVGAMIGSFGTYWVDHRISGRGMARGAGFCLIAALIAGFIDLPIQQTMAASSPFAGRVIGWILLEMLLAAGVAFPDCFRQPGMLRGSIPYAVLGGLVAGTLCSFGGYVPEVLTALGFTFGAIGIGVGTALPSEAGGRGVVAFVNSEDKRTHDKYSSRHATWEVAEDQAFVFGSGQADPAEKDTFVWLGDPNVAPRHARVFARNGRFVISRAPEIRNQAGLARFILKIGGETVDVNRDLKNDDEIVLGATILTFRIQKEGR